MTDKLTILHLSDAHIGNPSTKLDSHEVFQSLLDDLKSVSKKHSLSPDVVIFSGDLAYGDIPEASIEQQYERAKKWLEDLLQVLGKRLENTRLLLVPGNHDLNTNHITNQMIEWIANKNRTEDDIYNLMHRKHNEWEQFLRPQKQWLNFYKGIIHPEIRLNEKLHTSSTILTVRDHTIGIAGFNTSWASRAKGNDEKETLWLGQVQIQELAKELRTASFKIAVTHHPLTWLSPKESQKTREHLSTAYRVHFSGHEHHDWFVDASGHLSVEAGPCYAGSKRENGYSWLVLDFGKKQGRLYLREYSSRGGGGWKPHVIPNKTKDDGIAKVQAFFNDYGSSSKSVVDVAHANRGTTRILPKPKSNFSGLRDLGDYVSELHNSFDFEYEPPSISGSYTRTLIYWPVRLRFPTPIHAVQCFTAAGLQTLGADICLYIDDLGADASTHETFRNYVRKWFERAKGDFEKVSVAKFGEVVGNDDNSSEIWRKVQHWLVAEDMNFATLLEVSKIKMSSLEELRPRRPRKILSPPLVWSCLGHLLSICRNNGRLRIYTLGGYDERRLWELWRKLGLGANLSVGHLYIPELKEHGTIPGDELTVHMERTPLNWSSRDDVKTAILRDIETEAGYSSRNRLLQWCLQGCVRLPSYLVGSSQEFTIKNKPMSCWQDLDKETVAQEVANWVSKWYL